MKSFHLLRAFLQPSREDLWTQADRARYERYEGLGGLEDHAHGCPVCRERAHPNIEKCACCKQAKTFLLCVNCGGKLALLFALGLPLVLFILAIVYNSRNGINIAP